MFFEVGRLDIQKHRKSAILGDFRGPPHIEQHDASGRRHQRVKFRARQYFCLGRRFRGRLLRESSPQLPAKSSASSFLTALLS